MSYFSEQREKYKVYVVGEAQNISDVEASREKMAEYNITMLAPISTFSISSPLRTLNSITTLSSYISGYKIDLVHILFATPHALWANFIKVPYIITTRRVGCTDSIA